MEEKKFREAIEELKNFVYVRKRTLASLPNSVQKTSYVNSEIKAAETAIEALEKQLPKKLNEICGIFGEKYECQNCGSSLKDIDALAGYCKWCGQRVEV